MTRIEFPWVKSAFPFVVGLALMDAHAAAPLLPAGVVPVAYRIAVEPDLATSRFGGTEEIDIVVKQSTDTVVVNATALAIDTAKLMEDGNSQASVSLDEKAGTATLHFPRPLSVGRHTLAISYSGSIRPEQSGMFSVRYGTAESQKQMLATQFEFSAARRMFPCWDEPSAKAIFTLSAALPANYVAISNMPITAESAAGVDASGVPLRRVTFGTTPKMSSYLLVLVAGELQAIHGQAGKVGVAVWTTGDAQLGRAALEQTQKLLPLYGHYFGIEYPLPKLDLIAVPRLAFDPTATAVLNAYIPAGNLAHNVTVGKGLPNAGAVVSEVNGWSGYFKSPYDNNEYLGKLDHQFTQDNHMTVSYFQINSQSTVSGGGNLLWSEQTDSAKQKNLNVSDSCPEHPAAPVVNLSARRQARRHHSFARRIAHKRELSWMILLCGDNQRLFGRDCLIANLIHHRACLRLTNQSDCKQGTPDG